MKTSETEFSLIQPALLKNNDSIRAWFTRKNGGFSQSDSAIPGLNLGFNTPDPKEIVARNRLALMDSLGLDQEWVAYADQVHSNRIRLVTQGGTYPSTDGLITEVPGLTLGIQVADCAAVLLWDSEKKIIAALHAGWRGAAGDIVPRGIEMMTAQGADAKKIKAFVSPCLSLKDFEVGNEVANLFPGEYVDYERFAKPHVDLKRYLRHQMEYSGLSEANIEVREECTVAQGHDFYSYRREGKKSGRMMALIQISD
ncbi:MAG: peptidoglycan editing factor PgeF [Balneolaceae bacterium]|jgi:YfiH family protein